MTMKTGYMWMYREGVLGQSSLHGYQKVTPLFTSLLFPSSPPFLVFPLCTHAFVLLQLSFLRLPFFSLSSFLPFYLWNYLITIKKK